MRGEHRSIQSWISSRYASIYNVEAEINAQNRLPDKIRHWYQPDVILRDRGGDIKYIIEVECDPVRKAIVGASVLADACLQEIGQKDKAKLLFVIYGEDGIKQIANFREKIRIAKPYCKHLEDIQVLSVEEFESLQL